MAGNDSYCRGIVNINVHHGVTQSMCTFIYVKEVTMGNKTRGFASMSPEKRREVSSKGGKAAHAKGTSHKWTPEEAKEAGKVGGKISRRSK
jgi:hypothetical protein